MIDPAEFQTDPVLPSRQKETEELVLAAKEALRLAQGVGQPGTILQAIEMIARLRGLL